MPFTPDERAYLDETYVRRTVPTPADTAAARFNWGPEISRYSDVFSYEGAPDPKKWAAAGEPWPGHARNGERRASRSVVGGGFLRQTGTADGKTGWLASRLSWQYARLEVRCRSLPNGANPGGGRQYHPVLILWPTNNDWPAGAEYDFLENGAPGMSRAEAYLHYPNHRPRIQEHAAKDGVDLTQWHNVGFEWSRTGLVGYIDGAEWFRFDRDGIQNAPGPMHLTIQLDAFVPSGLQPAFFDVQWAKFYNV